MGDEIYLGGRLDGLKVLDKSGLGTAKYSNDLNIDTTAQEIVLDNDNVVGTVQKGATLSDEQIKALPPMNKLQNDNFFKVQGNYEKDKFVARYNEILPNIENIITAYD